MAASAGTNRCLRPFSSPERRTSFSPGSCRGTARPARVSWTNSRRPSASMRKAPRSRPTSPAALPTCVGTRAGDGDRRRSTDGTAGAFEVLKRETPKTIRGLSIGQSRPHPLVHKVEARPPYVILGDRRTPLGTGRSVSSAKNFRGGITHTARPPCPPWGGVSGHRAAIRDGSRLAPQRPYRPLARSEGILRGTPCKSRQVALVPRPSR